MSKIKSFQLLFIAIVCMAVFACGGSGTSSDVTSNTNNASEPVVEEVEAQTKELESAEKEIEEKIEGLDAALNALDL